MSEVPEKAVNLIRNYGQFFDDKYAYWQPRGRKGQLLPLLKRRPIWMNGKRMPAEKHIPKWIDAKKQGQRRLLEEPAK